MPRNRSRTFLSCGEDLSAFAVSSESLLEFLTSMVSVTLRCSSSDMLLMNCSLKMSKPPNQNQYPQSLTTYSGTSSGGRSSMVKGIMPVSLCDEPFIMPSPDLTMRSGNESAWPVKATSNRRMLKSSMAYEPSSIRRSAMRRRYR